MAILLSSAWEVSWARDHTDRIRKGRPMLKVLRMAIIALLLAVSAASAAPVVAQETTPAPGQVTGQVEDVVEDDDGGFEWGLLGLLGLAGLAGLMRRPQPVVHDDMNRTSRTTGVHRDDDRTTI
jgi:MYXO-CTERM domain-containing protein